MSARRLLATLREGSFLTRERVIAYASMALVVYAAVALVFVVTSRGNIAINGEPLGTDYVSFWSAGTLALQGQATAAYDPAAHAAQESATFGPSAVGYVWTYPPTFLLLAAILAVLPYGWSLALWLATSGAAYVALIRRIVPQPGAVTVALALPAVLLNAGHGQNGFLSAALLGGGLWLLGSRPALAGILFGLLCYKPQMAVLLPLALTAGRHWRTLCAMVGTIVVLYGLTVLAFGYDIWPLAYETMRSVAQGRVLEQGAVPYWKMVTVFAATRALGGDVAVAWSMQWIAAAASAALVVAVWASRKPLHLKGALLVAAVPLTTPVCLDYDLVMLAVPTAWLVRDGLRDGFLPWERSGIAAVALMPALVRPLGLLVPLPLAALIDSAFVVLIMRRMMQIP